MDRARIERLARELEEYAAAYGSTQLLIEDAAAAAKVLRAMANAERSGCSECNEEGAWRGVTCEECNGKGYFLLLLADAADTTAGEG